MASNILWADGTVQPLTSSGASLTNGSAALAGFPGTIDLTAAGNETWANDLVGIFELTAQWATVSGISAATTVAQLYMVPTFDGTNYADVDLSSGASNIPGSTLKAMFPAAKAPTANTNMLFASNEVLLLPLKYRIYLKNSSGQTMAANWTLKWTSFHNRTT